MATSAPPATAAPVASQDSLRAHAWPALAGLVLGLLALGPALGRGFVLSYDMVFVPAPPVGYADLGLGGGPPRAVPSDLVVALTAKIIPAPAVQKMILIAIFVLACTGAAALLAAGWRRVTDAASAPLLARLVAGVCYAWNPFIAERLIMGQWAMLLGYAALPWLLREVARAPRRRAWGLAVALVPAAVGGFAAVSVSALPALVVAASAAPNWAQRGRRLLMTAGALAIASLPWLIPSLLNAVHADPSGAAAFTARADTPFGAAGSLLLLGGIWNAEAVPAGYGGPVTAFWLTVVLTALAGYVLAARRRHVCPGLGVAGAASFCLAAAGLTPPTLAALRAGIAAWPGLALLRDGQQFLAPLALVIAIGLGAGVAALLAASGTPAARRTEEARTGEGRTAHGEARADRRSGADAGDIGRPSTGARPGAAGPAIALGVMALLAPVFLLPGLAWGAAGRLQAVQYPADWLRARQIIDGDHHRGSALLLPWAEYRRFPWNHGEAVFDPWPRLLSRPMIWNDALQVGRITVAAESDRARQLTPIIDSRRPLTRALRRLGVRYVVVDAGPLLRPGLAAGRLPGLARLPGARVIVASRDLVVFRLPPPAT